jgi:hypothetical protein
MYDGGLVDLDVDMDISLPRSTRWVNYDNIRRNGMIKESRSIPKARHS